MNKEISYSKNEQFWLWTLAVIGFVAINGAFFYGLLFQPDALTAAMANPISAAFLVEATVMMGVFAYLLSKWKVSRLSWWWFVILSLAGSMAFALPVVILWPYKRR